MKNLFLTAAIVLGSLTSFAATNTVTHTVVKNISIEGEFTEIKVTEVPAPIIESLKKAHPDAIITKAYKNEKAQYKLDIVEGTNAMSLLANADGTWALK